MGCFSPPKQTVQQVSQFTPQQKTALSDLLGTVTPFIGEAPPVYSGQRLAGFSPLQQKAFNQAGQGQNYLNQATQPFDFQGFAEPITAQAQQLYGDLTDNLATQFGATGSADSGLFQKELARGAERLSTNVAAQLAPYAFQGYETQTGNQLRRDLTGASLSPQLVQNTFSLGSAQQAQQQAQLDLDQQLFNERGPLAFLQNPAFSAASQLSGLPVYDNAVMQKPAGLGYSYLSGQAESAESAGTAAMLALMGGA